MKSEINSGETLLNEKKSAFLPISLYILIYLLIASVAFFYFFAFIPVDGESMESTIHDGQKCFIQRNAFSVNRGDIVTINTSNSGEAEHIIIKRVVGIEGDKLVFMKNSDDDFVNLYICKAGSKTFTILNEPYIKENMSKFASGFNSFTKKESIKVTDDTYVSLMPYKDNLTELDITDENTLQYLQPYMISIPKNSFYFLGDNRNISRDARYYGLRTINSVTGKVLFIF